jgi:uncharacterized protein
VSRATSPTTTVEIDTPTGPGRVHLHLAEAPVAALVLGHGAGGGVAARDLVVAADVALGLAISVGLVEQPYRAAGRRSPPRAPVLDAAWTAIVGELRASHLAGLPLIVGGRSSGARVACRTAAATGAVGVLCLAFPLQPARRSTGVQAPSRLAELDAVEIPVLIVQGARDPFGMPPAGPRRTVAAVAGDHGLKSDLEAVARAVGDWLSTIVAASGGGVGPRGAA